MIAISVGLGLVNVIKPGKFIEEKTRVRLVNKYTDKTSVKVKVANDLNIKIISQSEWKKMLDG